MTRRLTLLYALPCKLCKKEFVYCLKSGRDFRCPDCKSMFGTLADVEKELAEMSSEELSEFKEEIEEFEKSQK